MPTTSQAWRTPPPSTRCRPTSVDKPVGQLQIFNVQGTFNQELSLTTARSTALGIDPLGVPDDVKDLVEIVTYTPIAHDGLQGSRVVYNLHNEGEPWQTVDATTLFDQSRNRFYVLRIGCTSECFKTNQDAIGEIATLLEGGPVTTRDSTARAAESGGTHEHAPAPAAAGAGRPRARRRRP